MTETKRGVLDWFICTVCGGYVSRQRCDGVFEVCLMPFWEPTRPKRVIGLFIQALAG